MFLNTVSTCTQVSNLQQLASLNVANSTALLMRDGCVVGRFNVKRSAEAEPLIFICHDPKLFIDMMHKMAIQGVSEVEMLLNDGTSYVYTYRG